MPDMKRRLPVAALALALSSVPVGALAQILNEDGPAFPTTEFPDGATTASVSVGDVTATVAMERKPDIDPDNDVPLLTVTKAGAKVLEAAGVASGFEFPTAEASLADIDPDNPGPEVYFTSYSGGAHCCSTVIVGDQVGNGWVAVDVGDFDGDGNFLNDANGDGLAEIVTVDNRFLYQFDCYACSAAPLQILTVRGGKVFDVSTAPEFQGANRAWLKQIEDNVDPAERWTSMGYLAGWVAAKTRIGEGAQAWKDLEAHWDYASDPGEEVCPNGSEPEECAKKDRVMMKFPDRLKLFLDQAGYRS